MIGYSKSEKRYRIPKRHVRTYSAFFVVLSVDQAAEGLVDFIGKREERSCRRFRDS